MSDEKLREIAVRMLRDVSGTDQEWCVKYFREAYELGRSAEREACAQVCDKWFPELGCGCPDCDDRRDLVASVASAIRGRAQGGEQNG